MLATHTQTHTSKLRPAFLPRQLNVRMLTSLLPLLPLRCPLPPLERRGLRVPCDSLTYCPGPKLKTMKMNRKKKMHRTCRGHCHIVANPFSLALPLSLSLSMRHVFPLNNKCALQSVNCFVAPICQL